MIDYLDPVRIAERAIAAARYHAALTAALPLAGARALADGPTAGELLLEAGFARQTQPVLAELYRQPILAGLEAMVEQTEADMIRSILAYYQARPELPGRLGEVGRSYGRVALNMGGQMGLEELGLSGQFEATDETVLGAVDAAVGRLTDTRRGARRSAVVTTAEDVAGQVAARRDEGLAVVDMIPVLTTWMLGRVVVRSALIAATESVRMNRLGMVWAFVGNGIRGVRHECEGNVDDTCRGGICPAMCGVEYETGSLYDPMGDIPAAARIPLHPRCRCHYSPLRDGWERPAVIWTGFALAALADLL